MEYALTKQGLETHIGELNIADTSSLPVQGAIAPLVESHELAIIVQNGTRQIVVLQVALATPVVSCFHQVAARLASDNLRE